jgi:hypothetical protein
LRTGGTSLPRLRLSRAFIGFVTFLLIALAPSPASATVAGPCQSQVLSDSVDKGRDTPATAVRVAAGHNIEVSGGVVSDPLSAGYVNSVRYRVQIAGLDIQASIPGIANGESPTWGASIGNFAWATAGLVLVRMEARTTQGTCQGVFYLCLQGRNPITTVLGGLSLLLGLGGVILLVLTGARLRKLSLPRAAIQAFIGDMLATFWVGVFLQQRCVSPLDPSSAYLLPVLMGCAGAIVASAAWVGLNRGLATP